MAKESKKHIKAQVINELTKKFNQRISEVVYSRDHWREQAIKAENSVRPLMIQVQELKNERDELKVKLEQYEEWIERMQEFCNLSESERKQAFKTYMDNINATKEANKAVEQAASLFNRLGLGLFM